MEGSGALDLEQQRFRATISVTGGEHPSGGRVVVGADSYQRPSDGEEWVHVDLKRVEPDDLFVGFDWADPTGMTAFTSSIVSAQRTGTHTYTGRLHQVVPPSGCPEHRLDRHAPVALHDHH